MEDFGSRIPLSFMKDTPIGIHETQQQFHGIQYNTAQYCYCDYLHILYANEVYNTQK